MPCPRLIPSQIHEKMEALKHIGIDVLDMLEQCPPPLPKASRMTRRRGRRHGGAMLTREHVKTAIYVLIVGLAGLAIFSENPNKSMVVDGIKAVLNGSCNSLVSTVYQAWGLENPVCTRWNAVLAVVRKALQGDAISLGILSGVLSAPYVSYKATTRAVNLISDKILEQIAHTTEDDDAAASPVQQRRLQNGLSDRLRITNRRTDTPTPPPPPPPPPPTPPPSPPTPPPPSNPSVPTLFQHFGDEDKSRRSKRSRSSRKK